MHGEAKDGGCQEGGYLVDRTAAVGGSALALRAEYDQESERESLVRKLATTAQLRRVNSAGIACVVETSLPPLANSGGSSDVRSKRIGVVMVSDDRRHYRVYNKDGDGGDGGGGGVARYCLGGARLHARLERRHWLTD